MSTENANYKAAVWTTVINIIALEQLWALGQPWWPHSSTIGHQQSCNWFPHTHLTGMPDNALSHDENVHQWHLDQVEWVGRDRNW